MKTGFRWRLDLAQVFFLLHAGREYRAFSRAICKQPSFVLCASIANKTARNRAKSEACNYNSTRNSKTKIPTRINNSDGRTASAIQLPRAFSEARYPIAPAQNAKPVPAHHSPVISVSPRPPVSSWVPHLQRYRRVPHLQTCRPSGLGLGAGRKGGNCQVEDLDGAVEDPRHRNRSYRSHQSGLSRLLLTHSQ